MHSVQEVWRIETLLVFLLPDVLSEVHQLHALADQDF